MRTWPLFLPPLLFCFFFVSSIHKFIEGFHIISKIVKNMSRISYRTEPDDSICEEMILSQVLGDRGEKVEASICTYRLFRGL